MAMDEGFDENTGNKSEETNEEQVERIYHILFEAIPEDVCYFNVLTALGQLVLETSVVLHEECHMESNNDDNISPIRNLPGTPFGNN